MNCSLTIHMSKQSQIYSTSLLNIACGSDRQFYTLDFLNIAHLRVKMDMVEELRR